MIDAKQAVLIAKQRASEILDWAPVASSLEELERDSYKGRDVWSITLGLPRNPGPIEALSVLHTNWLQYKRFLIDAETGELVALKLREVA
jgi:hypothetical protein